MYTLGVVVAAKTASSRGSAVSNQVSESLAARALAKAGFLNPAFGANWCTKHEEVSFEEGFEKGPIWVFESERDRQLKPVNELRRAYPSGVLSDVEAGHSWVVEEGFTKHLICVGWFITIRAGKNS